MAACVSCELDLPRGILECPACGTLQRTESASAEEARCAVHTTVVAKQICARCGHFMCTSCVDVDSADDKGLTCRPCQTPRHAELVAELAKQSRRLGLASMLQAALCVPLAFFFGPRQLVLTMAAFAVPAMVLGALTLATGSLWIVAPIACGLLGFVGVLAVSIHPVFLVTLVLPVVMARWFFALTPLERELGRLRPQG